MRYWKPLTEKLSEATGYGVLLFLMAGGCDRVYTIIYRIRLMRIKKPMNKK
jgi:hypothetical protein